ncbi:MAG: GNAT family N-acetyltransferase, partial [Candidatus Peribacteraceae bacterium]|nr:GNAT family N-acetyltransferase [Candidatus Peribacteraceae bacterium]
AASAAHSRELDTPDDIEPIAAALAQAADVQERAIRVDILSSADAGEISQLILGDSPAYRMHFTPFPFGEAELAQRFGSVQKDRYWAIRIGGSTSCFFMLRGFDEGYQRPSFGVYVGERFAGMGLAALALQHALVWCRLHHIASVMLKVHPDNVSARHIYERSGFVFESVCPQTHHHLLVKTLQD